MLLSVIITANLPHNYKDAFPRKTSISEERDKERRRSNLMIFNIPEVNSADTEETKHYDRQMVISVLNQVMEVTDIEHNTMTDR